MTDIKFSKSIALFSFEGGDSETERQNQGLWTWALIWADYTYLLYYLMSSWKERATEKIMLILLEKEKILKDKRPITMNGTWNILYSSKFVPYDIYFSLKLKGVWFKQIEVNSAKRRHTKQCLYHQQNVREDLNLNHKL